LSGKSAKNLYLGERRGFYLEMGRGGLKKIRGREKEEAKAATETVSSENGFPGTSRNVSKRFLEEI